VSLPALRKQQAGVFLPVLSIVFFLRIEIRKIGAARPGSLRISFRFFSSTRRQRRNSMRVAILNHRVGYSAYLAEMLKTWGLPLFDVIEPAQVAALDPAQTSALICPASSTGGEIGDAAVAFAQRGGSVITALPEGALAAAAQLKPLGEKEGALRLRVTGRVAAGLAGEMLPVVGRAVNFERGEGVSAVAYLIHPGRWDGETVGITSTNVGRGRIVAFAFDLPHCVMLLRQGDPARAEKFPPHDVIPRASHLGIDIGPLDSGWIPFADLLTRLFVDIVRDELPGPAPMLHHMPGEARAVVLYSGDEDGAKTEWDRAEFDFLTRHGARMNLYIIPTATSTTAADAEEFSRHHDLGVHPDLRSLDGKPMADRIAEYDRQIGMFTEMYGMKPRSLRNHCLAWAGYLELVEVQAKHGVRMDTNCVSGAYYFTQRDHAPYGRFGAAMPMRFTRPDGSLIDVIQQPTQISDDLQLNDKIEYSAKFSPEQYEVIFSRMLDDAAGRFHTPIGLCIHPSNFVTYSGESGRMIVHQAQRRGIPVWSFDQWSEFWDARDTWRFSGVTWDGSTLAFEAVGADARDDLRVALTADHGRQKLKAVRAAGVAVEFKTVERYGKPMALITLPRSQTSVKLSAEYA